MVQICDANFYPYKTERLCEFHKYDFTKYKGEQLPLGFGSDCNRWMAYWGHHYIFDVGYHC